jgi:hypothetical protein
MRRRAGWGVGATHASASQTDERLLQAAQADREHRVRLAEKMAAELERVKAQAAELERVRKRMRGGGGGGGG